MRWNRTAAVLLAACAIAAVTGCGQQERARAERLPRAWKAVDVRRAERLATSSGAGEGACTGFKVIEPTALKVSRARYGWTVVPTAIGDCDRGSEIIEFATFRSSADRDQFIAERTASLCRRAAAVSAPLPPFAWVRGGSPVPWSAQSDAEVTATSISKRAGGSVTVRRCDLDDPLGWRRSGVRVLRDLALRVGTAGIRCNGFAIVDRLSLKPQPSDDSAPAALGTCDTTPATSAAGPAQSVPMVFATFDARSEDREAFIAGAKVAGQRCVVLGQRWAVVAPPSASSQVAKVLGGRVDPPCG